jgi:two-component system, sensor histidine kinase and response regulator
MSDLNAEIYARKIARETSARRQAEALLEQKSLELYNQAIQREALLNQFKDSEWRYRTLIESSTNAILLICNSEIIFINQTGQELFEKIAVKELLNENDLSAQGSVQQFYEKTLKFEDGKKHTFEITKINTSYLSMPAIQIMIADITDKKIALEEKQSHELAKIKVTELNKVTKLKSDFLANMSHEIRTPMNVIIGITHLLKDTALDGEQIDYLNIIQSSSNNLLDIINDILDLSKIEAGKLNIDSVEFSICNLVDECAEVMSFKANEKELNLITFVDPKIQITTIGDPLRIKQILINLISNAIKFTNKGDVLLEVNLLAEKTASVEIEFLVKDSGIGIAKNKLKDIFLPFTQEDNTIAKRFGGTGLGLSICKQLASLMNGKINVESKEGVGSCFKVIFLMEKGSLNIRPTMPGWLVKKKVLLLDTNEARKKVLQAYIPTELILYPIELLDETLEDFLAKNILDLVIISSDLDSQAYDLLNKALQQYQPNVKKLALVNRNALEKIPFQYHALINAPIKESILFETITRLLDRRQKNIFVGSDGRNVRGVKQQIIEGTSNLNALVVDDYPLNLKVAVGLLKRIGLEVEVAGCGKEALDIIKKKNFSIVFMDCQMPDMDGYEVTKQIRKIEELQKHKTPIIALTASLMKGEKEKCIASGMDDFLSKPIDVNALSAIVNRWASPFISDVLINEINNKVVFNAHVNKSTVVNLSLLNEMFGGSQETIFALLQEFIEITPAILIQLSSCIEKADLYQVSKLCHRIVGSSSSFGLEEMTLLCRQLEHASLDKNQDLCIELYQQIMPAFERVADYVQNNFNNVVNHE